MGALLALVLASLSLVFVASAVVTGRAQVRALVRVDPAPLAEPLLVVIPARNEAARIGATLRALLSEDARAGLRVLVVDDRSTDDTARVVAAVASADIARADVAGAGAAGRVRILALSDEPPAGTFGKPRALHAAVEDARARGELTARVMFLDADVVLAPGALGGMLRAKAASGAAALSGVPRLVCATAVEQMLVPAFASVVTGRFLPTRVHDPARPDAFLNGQLVLVDTAALDDAGGWAAVSSTVLEDVALARNLKARGHALRLADLRALASTRMYDSWRAIDEGFGKNATALLGERAGLVGALAFMTSLLPWAAAALAIGALTVDAHTDAVYAGAALALVAAVHALQASARRTARVSVWPVLVLPLVYAAVAFTLVRASLRRTIAWRGRVYPRA